MKLMALSQRASIYIMYYIYIHVFKISEVVGPHGFLAVCNVDAHVHVHTHYCYIYS